MGQDRAKYELTLSYIARTRRKSNRNPSLPLLAHVSKGKLARCCVAAGGALSCSPHGLQRCRRQSHKRGYCADGCRDAAHALGCSAPKQRVGLGWCGLANRRFDPAGSGIRPRQRHSHLHDRSTISSGGGPNRYRWRYCQPAGCGQCLHGRWLVFGDRHGVDHARRIGSYQRGRSAWNSRNPDVRRWERRPVRYGLRGPHLGGILRLGVQLTFEPSRAWEPTLLSSDTGQFRDDHHHGPCTIVNKVVAWRKAEASPGQGSLFRPLSSS